MKRIKIRYIPYEDITGNIEFIDPAGQDPACTMVYGLQRSCDADYVLIRNVKPGSFEIHPVDLRTFDPPIHEGVYIIYHRLRTVFASYIRQFLDDETDVYDRVKKHLPVMLDTVQISYESEKLLHFDAGNGIAGCGLEPLIGRIPDTELQVTCRLSLQNV